MKTTLDIADDLLLRAKKVAQQQGVTVRTLVEAGLTVVLQEAPAKPIITPVTFGGKGKQAEVAMAPWETIRDTIYKVT